jgi:nucleoside-diphosphate-sugar epimerase
MNIFITGASGYIGSILVKSLSKHFSIVAGSQKKISPLLKKQNIKYKIVNYKSAKSLEKNLENIDAIIHLVGMNKVECEKKKKKSLVFKEKVTLNIIKACKYNKIKKLIYLSSSKVYKDFQKKSVNEKSKLDKVDPYSLSHLLAEKIILSENIENYTIIRASNIFGIFEKKKYGEQKNNLVHSLIDEAIKYNSITLKNPNIKKNFLPISILIANIKLILNSNKYDGKIMNLGFKSISLYNLAKKIKDRFKSLKNKKINILITKKLNNKKSNHKYTSLIKKFAYSQKKFIIEIDNIINLLMKKNV